MIKRRTNEVEPGAPVDVEALKAAVQASPAWSDKYSISQVGQYIVVSRLTETGAPQNVISVNPMGNVSWLVSPDLDLRAIAREIAKFFHGGNDVSDEAGERMNATPEAKQDDSDARSDSADQLDAFSRTLSILLDQVSALKRMLPRMKRQ